jgi:hypothetical protein
MKKQVIIVLISVLLLVTGYVLNKSVHYSICGIENRTCTDFTILEIGQPMFFAFRIIVPTLFLIFFVRNEVFKFWLKRISIYTVLAFLWVAFAPVTCYGVFCIYDKWHASQIAGFGFLILTVILLLYKTSKIRDSV